MSIPPEGFWSCFPAPRIILRDSETQGERLTTSTAIAPSNRRILLVDDEQGIRDLLRDFFEIEEFEVFEAPDGAGALEMVKQSRFDVVLTDLKMPGRDGLEVLRQIRHVCPDTAVLMLTGYPSTESIVKALELGCDGYLSKPINLSELKYMTLRGLIFRKWEKAD